MIIKRLTEIAERYYSFIFERFNAENRDQSDTLTLWQNRFMGRLMLYLLPISIILYIPSQIMAFSENFYIMAAYNTIAVISIFFIAYNKSVLIDIKKSEMLSPQPPVYYFVSGFEHPYLPVITTNGIIHSQWGLIPHWYKNENRISEIKKMTLNAVSETAYEKPSFKKAIESQRCLLGINGFFEWRTVNNKKYPYYIHPDTQSLFSLGCIYDLYKNPKDDSTIHSFSILTTPANPLMEFIHNTKKRMPLIIAPEHEKSWMDPALPALEIKKLMQPFPEMEMKAHQVSEWINNPKNNRNIPNAIQPIESSFLF